MSFLATIKREFKEAVAWAKKSWTIHFNTVAALCAVFAENLSQLAGVVEDKIYALLVVTVPAVNILLRAKTQKKVNNRSTDELG